MSFIFELSNCLARLSTKPSLIISRYLLLSLFGCTALVYYDKRTEPNYREAGREIAGVDAPLPVSNGFGEGRALDIE
jgi:hypothetical protein